MIFRDGTTPFELPGSRVRVVFGAGRLSELGRLAREEGGRRVLLVTDPNIRAAGHVERALASLRAAGLDVFVFDGVAENPTTVHVDAGVVAARAHGADFIVGLGGGSAMDCAKGINFIVTNGGRMQDYWGVNKATRAMLPMIAVPTTAGTGSEAQSFALITDPDTHQKMACGDQKATCRVAILDPELTESQPRRVAAVTGFDAVSHAVETAATARRTDDSRALSRESWRLLESAYETAVRDPHDRAAREKMLQGAHLAGAAIENSMLGAAHACANPLTAMFGLTHGVAIGIVLPHVVRFNAAGVENPYAELCADAEALAARLEALLSAGGMTQGLADFGVSHGELAALAESAAAQWTAQFNPRPVGARELLEIYRRALEAPRRDGVGMHVA